MFCSKHARQVLLSDGPECMRCPLPQSGTSIEAAPTFRHLLAGQCHSKLVELAPDLFDALAGSVEATSELGQPVRELLHVARDRLDIIQHLVDFRPACVESSPWLAELSHYFGETFPVAVNTAAIWVEPAPK